MSQNSLKHAAIVITGGNNRINNDGDVKCDVL